MPTRMRSIPIPRQPLTHPFQQAAISAAAYILLCAGYILVSGHLAARMAKTPEQLHDIETVKGIAFIVITGILYFIISFMLGNRIRRQENALIKEETTLLQAEKKIVAAMSAAMVAHDLNNLLLSLSGLLEKIKAQERSDPSLNAMGGHIDANVAKLRHLAKRLEAGVGHAVSETKEAVDMGPVIEEMVSVVRAHPDVRSCRVACDNLAPVTLKLNRVLFEEAVLNLLINAAQATGPTGQIEIRLGREAGAAILAVHDNGPGVPDFLVGEIFEPCFSTKPGGTGIGLLAVSAFAASCGAEVSVGRSPLGGALFQLCIPIPEPRRPARPAP